jgi:hypothetical protein
MGRHVFKQSDEDLTFFDPPRNGSAFFSPQSPIRHITNLSVLWLFVTESSFRLCEMILLQQSTKLVFVADASTFLSLGRLIPVSIAGNFEFTLRVISTSQV